jgi:hypothetical protein
MVDATIPNQANFQDAQTFDIDINKIYSDFIQAIDKVRSYNITTSITDQAVKNALASNVATIKDARSALSKLAQLSTTPQESRCHAFFRIIGFPVSDSSKKIFNPGLDIVFSEDRKVDDTFKLGIIKSQITDFRKLSIARESFVSNNLNIFSLQQGIDASTLSLSSGLNVRPFITPLNDTDGFNVDPTAQEYEVNFLSKVGEQPKKLTEYIDILGNKPTKLLPKRQHLIRPFLVDPIIDLTVNDATKLIAVPFVPDKSYLKVKDGANGFVNRPLIEQVVRDRLSIINQASTTGTADQSVLDYIKNVPAITDEDIISKAADVYKLTDQNQFVKFLNIIRAMVKKLIEAQNTIQAAITEYYWLPIPSKTGPEGGCSTRGVLLSDKIESTFITVSDQAIIMAKIQAVVNQANVLSANAQGTPDVGGFAFDSFKDTFGPDTSTALGDNDEQNLQTLTAKRAAILDKANDALRTIEIIMGEFSGLGLCDIMAVLAALYLMPTDSLLGFLDDDAITRMNDAGLSGSASSLATATSDFIEVVKGFYNIMDKIYEDLSQNNGQTQA